MIKEPNQPSSPRILVTNTIEADFFSHAIAQVGVPDSCISFFHVLIQEPICLLFYGSSTPWELLIFVPSLLKQNKSLRIHTCKNNLFNKWCWENWSTVCKRMKLEHLLTPYTKINSKWINNLNVRPETIKLLGENIGRTLSDVNHGKILYDPPPRVKEIKTKINKRDLIKLKSFCTKKKTISKVKR